MLLLVAVGGSTVSCSLFRPRENDEDTWGDPHWKFDNGGSARVAPAAAPGGEAKLIGTSREADYWPTTEELETRGGSLSIADYDRTAQEALHGTEAPGTQQPGAAEHFALHEPALPSDPAAGPEGDPLAGFWDEQEQEADDYSDAEIQRVGAARDTTVADVMEPHQAPAAPAAQPDPAALPASVAEAGAPQATEPESPALLAPIPPSAAPARSDAIVSSAGAADGIAPMKTSPRPEAASPIPEVVLLDAGVAAADATAFDNVSLLSEKRVLTEQEAPASLLDRRHRVSLTEMGPAGDSDGPLLLPSIGVFESP